MLNVGGEYNFDRGEKMSAEEKLNLIGMSNSQRIGKSVILKNETTYKLTYLLEFTTTAHTYDEDTAKDEGVRWEMRGAVCSTDITDCAYDSIENILLSEKYSLYEEDVEGNSVLKIDGSFLGWGGTDVKTYDSRCYDTVTKNINLNLLPGEEVQIILKVVGHNAVDSGDGDTFFKGSGDQRFYTKSTEITWLIIGAQDV